MYTPYARTNNSFSGSQVTRHVPPSRNWSCQLQCDLDCRQLRNGRSVVSLALIAMPPCKHAPYRATWQPFTGYRWVELGGPLRKSLPRKKIITGNIKFWSSRRSQKFSKHLGALSLFKANFGHKTMSPIMTPLLQIKMSGYLILRENALSRPLGHPGGGLDEAGFSLVYPWAEQKRANQPKIVTWCDFLHKK